MTTETRVDCKDVQWWLEVLQDLVGALEGVFLLRLENRLLTARAAFQEMLAVMESDQQVREADACALELLAVMNMEYFDPRWPAFVEQKQNLRSLLDGLISRVGKCVVCNILETFRLERAEW